MLIKTYNAYVLPIFHFCCVIWSNTTAANQTRLVKLQKRAARLLLKADLSHRLSSFSNNLTGFLFPKTAHYHSCLMVHKRLNGLSPEYISSMFSFFSDHHERQTKLTTNNNISCMFPDHIRRISTSLFGHRVKTLE